MTAPESFRTVGVRSTHHTPLTSRRRLQLNGAAFVEALFLPVSERQLADIWIRQEYGEQGLLDGLRFPRGGEPPSHGELELLHRVRRLVEKRCQAFADLLARRIPGPFRTLNDRRPRVLEDDVKQKGKNRSESEKAAGENLTECGPDSGRMRTQASRLYHGLQAPGMHFPTRPTEGGPSSGAWSRDTFRCADSRAF